MARRALQSWASDAIFWAVNIGLAGFVVGLIMEATILYRIFIPLMGLGLLLAIGLYAWLLLRTAVSREAAVA